MYHQIAANRRKSVLVIFLFFLFTSCSPSKVCLMLPALCMREVGTIVLMDSKAESALK